jgi:serine/threonine protein kinase
MLNLDNDYPDNIYVRLQYSNPTESDVTKAFHLARFRKKRTELAWALVHIMNAVHVSGHLHNDISPDNIMFHFPDDESRVYIGICDWGMTTVTTEPMKSLYTFTSASEMNEALTRRWWVDPSIAYLHRRDANVEIIPHLSRASEEYAIGKIAQRINKQCMSENYSKLQRGNKCNGHV